MRTVKKGSGIYFGIILLLLVAAVWISQAHNLPSNYSHNSFMRDLENGDVTDAVITQNEQVPTGALHVTLKNGTERTLYVTDVGEMEDLLREHDINVKVKDVPQENWFLNYVLPIMVGLIVLVFIFVMLNAQNNNSASSNSRMMNFGKSRARR